MNVLRSGVIVSLLSFLRDRQVQWWSLPLLAVVLHALLPATGCYVQQTDQTLRLCEYSDWLPWDCSQCLNNYPGNIRKTLRVRAICCRYQDPMDSCLNACLKPPDSNKENEFCVKVCPLDHTVTSPSFKPNTTSTLKHPKPSVKNILTTSTTSQSTSPSTHSSTTAKVSAQVSVNNTVHTESLEQGCWCYLGSFRLKSNPRAPISICLLILVCICVVLITTIVAFIVWSLWRKPQKARSARVKPFIPRSGDSVL